MLKVGFQDQYDSYRNNLLLTVIGAVSRKDVIYVDGDCDILIQGPFSKRKKFFQRAAERLLPRKVVSASIRVFHSEENTRSDDIRADFFLTSDLGLTRNNHFRLPIWWSSLDWSSYGIRNTASPRIGRLITPSNLTKPLAQGWGDRAKSMAIVTSHLNEPRRTLVDKATQYFPVAGYGPAFDQSIKNHNSSPFFKEDVFKLHAFALCPENSMFPGYYTEKVPEAFNAGCIPITWADQNIIHDFQKGSFLNLADYAGEEYSSGFSMLMSDEITKSMIETSLLKEQANIEPLIAFVKDIVNSV